MGYFSIQCANGDKIKGGATSIIALSSVLDGQRLYAVRTAQLLTGVVNLWNRSAVTTLLVAEGSVDLVVATELSPVVVLFPATNFVGWSSPGMDLAVDADLPRGEGYDLVTAARQPGICFGLLRLGELLVAVAADFTGVVEELRSATGIGSSVDVVEDSVHHGSTVPVGAANLLTGVVRFFSATSSERILVHAFLFGSDDVVVTAD